MAALVGRAPVAVAHPGPAARVAAPLGRLSVESRFSLSRPGGAPAKQHFDTTVATAIVARAAAVDAGGAPAGRTGAGGGRPAKVCPPAGFANSRGVGGRGAEQ